ncbi:MAG: hypothetical protein ACXVBY_14215 [Isosphaeraceae bacterium]
MACHRSWKQAARNSGKTWYPGGAWFAHQSGGTGRHAGLDIELN